MVQKSHQVLDFVDNHWQRLRLAVVLQAELDFRLPVINCNPVSVVNSIKTFTPCFHWRKLARWRWRQRQSLLTCLGHLGCSDTDRIVSIFVATPKVVKASKQGLSQSPALSQALSHNVHHVNDPLCASLLTRWYLHVQSWITQRRSCSKMQFVIFIWHHIAKRFVVHISIITNILSQVIWNTQKIT